jgi:zinc protease
VDEFKDPGLFSIYAQLQPGKSVADVEKEIYGILDEIAQKGVSGDELQKARNTVQADYVKEFKTNVGIAGRLGYYEVVHGDYRRSFKVLDEYARVTLEDIARVVREYLPERKRTVVILVPERSEESSASTN